MLTHMGKELVVRAQSCPTPRGRGHSTPQFWGFFSIYAYTSVAELPDLTQ